MSCWEKITPQMLCEKTEVPTIKSFYDIVMKLIKFKVNWHFLQLNRLR